jgi:hypothetical protein
MLTKWDKLKSLRRQELKDLNFNFNQKAIRDFNSLAENEVYIFSKTTIVDFEESGFPKSNGAYSAAYRVLKSHQFSYRDEDYGDLQVEPLTLQNGLILKTNYFGLNMQIQISVTEMSSDTAVNLEGQLIYRKSFYYKTIGAYKHAGVVAITVNKNHYNGAISFTLNSVVRPSMIKNSIVRYLLKIFGHSFQKYLTSICLLALRQKTIQLYSR